MIREVRKSKKVQNERETEISDAFSLIFLNSEIFDHFCTFWKFAKFLNFFVNSHFYFFISRAKFSK